MTACFSNDSNDSRLSFLKQIVFKGSTSNRVIWYEKPFPREDELRVNSAGLVKLDPMLSLNENVQEGEIVVDDVIDNESLERKEYVQR